MNEAGAQNYGGSVISTKSAFELCALDMVSLLFRQLDYSVLGLPKHPNTLSAEIKPW